MGLAIAVALALLAGPRAALAAQPPDTVTGAWASHWLVELERPPAADGTSQAALGADHSRLRAETRAAGIRYRQRFAYKTLFNGVSMSASDAAAARIRNLDGVAAVYPAQPISLDVRTAAFEPEMAFALTMIEADIAQSQLGYTGRGIHVGHDLTVEQAYDAARLTALSILASGKRELGDLDPVT